jgi:hypothetical protein
VFLLVVSAYCSAHAGASQCPNNSLATQLVEILIVAAIVALAVFDLAWKLRRGTNGPIARVFVAAMSVVGRVFTPRRMR